MFTFLAFPVISIIVLIFATLYSLDSENNKKLRSAEAICVLMFIESVVATIWLMRAWTGFITDSLGMLPIFFFACIKHTNLALVRMV
jgi:hypothetical protein